MDSSLAVVKPIASQFTMYNLQSCQATFTIIVLFRPAILKYFSGPEKFEVHVHNLFIQKKINYDLNLAFKQSTDS